MENNKIILTVGSETKEFTSVALAMEHAKEWINKFRSRGLSPVFTISKNNETILKFRFRHIFTIETEIIKDQNP